MSDPDTPTWLTGVLSALGISSTGIGGWLLGISNRQAADTVKIEANTHRIDSHSEQIRALQALTTETRSKLDGAVEDIGEIKGDVKSILRRLNGQGPK